MTALFPRDAIRDPLECQRCGALVLESAQPRHEAWHRSVDTDETTDLHGFPAPTREPDKFTSTDNQGDGPV